MDNVKDTYAPLFYINGQAFKWIGPDDTYSESDRPGYDTVCNPGRDYQEKTEQLVNMTRDATGKTVAQTNHRRRLLKFDNLYWPYLPAESVTWLRRQIAKFEGDISFWDDESDSVITRKFYWGDYEATPCEWETIWYGGKPYKKPKWYKDVKCNLIDWGDDIGYIAPSN